jgi:hypothetical protein
MVVCLNWYLKLSWSFWKIWFAIFLYSSCSY